MAASLSNDIVLATSVHAQPGVYAVLLGSGVSRGAGVPTGWGVVQDLTARVAALVDRGNAESSERAREDPEAWWRDKFDGPLGYSSLLEKLADTPSERQGLLKGFFEPPAGDDEATGVPSSAHRAIASLAQRGYIKVIVTTNFDRLMEQALAEIGVEPQIVSRPEAVKGMTPLVHAAVTLVKLHGDYREVDSLNTETELGEYPQPWVDLLRQVVEDYGLVVSGWSADWDTALVRAIEDASSRRYSLYWDARSSKGENAQRILSVRDGRVLQADTADALFTSLKENVEALERIAVSPLSLDLMIARAKRYVADPVRRVDLHDLVMSEVDAVIEAIASMFDRFAQGSHDYQEVEDAADELAASTQPLLRVLGHGVFHDDGSHDALWTRVVQRLLDGPPLPATRVPGDVIRDLVRLPALLATYTYAVVGAETHRDSTLIKASLESRALRTLGERERVPGVFVTHVEAVLNADVINSVARAKGAGGWIYPGSHRARDMMQTVVLDFVPISRAREAFDDAEYRVALLQHVAPRGKAFVYGPHSGEFCGEFQWDEDGRPHAEQRFVDNLNFERFRKDWESAIGDDIPTALDGLRARLERHKRW
ncbi:SIR2 family protein [Demequina sp. NBRC 110052]|uniref:SIR2 family protein n=1 Tax=Demequina sp. NBRC 110052 TaxID=1570341 RepID=UPI000A02DC15|nr:SIR2 family protein [Demequina sp. NBRC 110052]